MRRARPHLGTIVEIEIDAGSDAAFDAAFAAIGQVERSFSFYDVRSAVGRFNRAAAGFTIRIDSDLVPCLEEAFRMMEATGGEFSCLLEEQSASRIRHDPGDYCELRGGTLRKRRASRLDLGGIAKGFAVDRAVRALRQSGASEGVVNAGGDIRVFGDRAQTILIRNPARPGRTIGSLRLKEGAVCTSSFKEVTAYERPGSPELRLRGSEWSGASVTAPEAMHADALTKLFSKGNAVDAGILTRFNARVFMIPDAA